MGPGCKKIIVALSGGVDSAVAAIQLIRAGHDVAALHMTNWEDDDSYCTAATDLQDARKICHDLGIPLHHVNFTADYREQVFTEFLAEYSRGRTPNPDVLCNREIKFGVFLDYAHRLGGELIATGHYARIDNGQQTRLLKGIDGNKDQSYFLHQVGAKAFEQTIFPLGAMEKSAVRRIAHEYGLSVYDKQDSTGICFIGERPFREFLGRFLSGEPGESVTPEGRSVGKHDGLMYYTLGQRQGLGIGGLAAGSNEPWFVAAKDEARNKLIVVQGRDHPLLWSEGLVTSTPHWINDEPAELTNQASFRCAVKTRYRQQDVPCLVSRHTSGGLQVEFDTPQWAVTPGQYAVFYTGDECLGGGPIDSARSEKNPVVATGRAPL
ncbi:MAG TPA: tRNA 2-thiouridine(34) synthase MnmA [Gammaproteobacteria bacterium]|jgi:tRNA-specific 2-thiouridylase|nr:tRNA 2-thiouridine(34) synthase MnmA [Chromatiales bacterium]MCP4927340.1 tRNA 2-thiouridine(34) synthase MnmA [Gammaproteobacteria bacterium]MDP7296048.1 tRNA 2-thiouridine(34) synthase MnmA [Gammaproteobacteria bacterium]HJP38669.1 tRNA 2-thiouridine(34) synthase MnmA [Gammaproteobacteria bacterium]